MVIFHWPSQSLNLNPIRIFRKTKNHVQTISIQSDLVLICKAAKGPSSVLESHYSATLRCLLSPADHNEMNGAFLVLCRASDEGIQPFASDVEAGIHPGVAG
ncbi:hypothetical protein AMECASPLE_003257 [Ameca splendens]|uniref:Uncharacterized protein n=1 Tax=Ameca splendens TaxID=208324 RepID=A0ABV0ZUD8_9TELE